MWFLIHARISGGWVQLHNKTSQSIGILAGIWQQLSYIKSLILGLIWYRVNIYIYPDIGNTFTYVLVIFCMTSEKILGEFSNFLPQMIQAWPAGDRDKSLSPAASSSVYTCISIFKSMFITRDSEVIMFSPCVFVCVCGCLCLSRCLSGRFNYGGLVPHKQYFADTLLGMPSCASYVSRTHDVIDDVTRSQSRSNFEIDISPSILELQRRSRPQNVGNAHGYLPGT